MADDYAYNEYDFVEDTRECEAMRKLFVGGLSKETTKETLESYFSQYGTLVDHNIAIDKKSKKSRGFGFVTFESSDSAEKVIKSRPHTIEENTLDCKRSLPKEMGPPATKLFVGGMSQEVDPEQFKEYIKSRHAEDIGKITKLDVVINKQTGVHKGFAFIECSSIDFADRLVLSESSIELCGRTVSIRKRNSEQPANAGQTSVGNEVVGGVPGEDMLECEAMRKLFVGGLSKETTKESLESYFSQYGTLVDHNVAIDKKSKLSRGFGFVTFESSDSVEKVFKSRPHALEGNNLTCNRTLPKECGPPSKRLFVGGMSQEVEPEKFKEYIKSRHPEDYGKITKLDVIINKQTGVHKGFAFIECSTTDFADRLVLSEGSFELCGRHIAITKKSSEKTDSTTNQGEKGGPQGRYINPLAAQMGGQPTIRLFVGGVSQEVQPAALLQYIESRYPPSMGGLITSIDVMIDKQSGKHKGFAFAECNSEELANVLCKNETKFELNGRSLSIQRRSDDKGSGSRGGASGARGGRRGDVGRGGGYTGQNGGFGGQPGGFGGQSGGFGGQSGGFGGQSAGFGGQPGGFGGQPAGFGGQPGGFGGQPVGFGGQPGGFGGQPAGFGGQPGGFGGQSAGFGGQPGGFGGQPAGFGGPGGIGGQPAGFGGTGGIGGQSAGVGQGQYGNKGGYGAAQNSFDPGEGKRW